MSEKKLYNRVGMFHTYVACVNKTVNIVSKVTDIFM